MMVVVVVEDHEKVPTRSSASEVALDITHDSGIRSAIMQCQQLFKKVRMLVGRAHDILNFELEME